MILTVNLGSASKRYALYDGESCLLSSHFERGDSGGLLVEYSHNGKEEHFQIDDREYKNSLGHFLRFSIDKGILLGEKKLSAVGIRIVAPGEYFTKHRLIDKEYEKNLSAVSGIVPLHIIPELEALKEIKALLHNVPIVGVSDSAFHSTINGAASRYALPGDVTEKYGIYRYGYHGISVESTAEKLKILPGGLPEKVIICHLGSGASITALQKGISIDTSMGFTPLEGVPMGSRSGSIDAGALLFLMDKLKLSPARMSEYLNTKAGLLGLSGKTADIRELLKLESKGDAKAALALEMFVYRIREHIGAYMAVLGGLDTLIFSGTIGERAPKIRARILERLENFGIGLDENKNNMYLGDKEGFINKDPSKTSVAVFLADEMKVIAYTAAQTANLS